MIKHRLLSSVFLIAIFSVHTYAGPIVPGFNTTSDGRNDDGTWTAPAGCTNAANGGTCAGTAIPLGMTLNFLGVTFSQLYVNTNGNITFDAPLSTFTPFGLTAVSREIIAPFFADVDTRNPASGVVTYGTGIFGGHNAFGVNWINVGYYSSHVDLTNSFQLLLVDRTDTGAGNFDVVFNYDNISWETGDASGGTGGLGGDTARVGFSNGSGLPGTSFELPGSDVDGALLNGGANGLTTHSVNSNVLGQYIFTARNGTVITQVPEPDSVELLGAGLLGVAFLLRKFRLNRS
jgi:hypothetical protein